MKRYKPSLMNCIHQKHDWCKKCMEEMKALLNSNTERMIARNYDCPKDKTIRRLKEQIRILRRQLKDVREWYKEQSLKPKRKPPYTKHDTDMINEEIATQKECWGKRKK